MKVLRTAYTTLAVVGWGCKRSVGERYWLRTDLCTAAVGQISVYEKLYAIVVSAFIGDYLVALHSFLFTACTAMHTSNTGTAW